MATGEVSVRCRIAGGGPAGMMLGLLLARAGVAVLVLEKHADFLRDFRGDTIHPSTLEIMHELGLLGEFLEQPHQEVRTLGAQIGDDFVRVADFSHLPTHCRFIALMPQWDFLSFIAGQAGRYPGFQLRMEADVTSLIEEGGRVTGVQAETAEGGLTVRADLVVGADGRHSTVRANAGLETPDLGAPMDVLWMRLSRRPTDPEQTLGRIDAGKIFVMLNRGDYWQCAFVIPKGGFERVHQAGLASFREEIVCASAMPPTPCPRSAASASISQFRMPSPRPTSWRRLFCEAGSPTRIFTPFSAAGNSPPGRCRRYRSSCRTGSSAASSRAKRNCRRRCLCACSRNIRCCSDCRPG